MSTRAAQDILDQDYSISITYLPNGKTVSFSGYITSFDDKFSLGWESEPVYGRMDPIQSYKSTSRSITFGFSVPSESETEGIANFKKLQSLLTFAYPVYEKSKNIPTGNNSQQLTEALRTTTVPSSGNAMLLYQPPLVAVKFANLISSTSNGNKLIGTFNDITYKLDVAPGVFLPKGQIVPKAFDMTFSLNVIHTSPLGWERDKENIKFRDETAKGKGKFPYGI